MIFFFASVMMRMFNLNISFTHPLLSICANWYPYFVCVFRKSMARGWSQNTIHLIDVDVVVVYDEVGKRGGNRCGGSDGGEGKPHGFFCCFCLKNILDSFMHFFWLLKKTTVKTLYSMDFMNENHAWYVIQFSVDVFLFSCLFFVWPTNQQNERMK